MKNENPSINLVGADIIRPPEISTKFRISLPSRENIGVAAVILFQNHRAATSRPYKNDRKFFNFCNKPSNYVPIQASFLFFLPFHRTAAVVATTNRSDTTPTKL